MMFDAYFSGDFCDFGHKIDITDQRKPFGPGGPIPIHLVVGPSLTTYCLNVLSPNQVLENFRAETPPPHLFSILDILR